MKFNQSQDRQRGVEDNLDFRTPKLLMYTKINPTQYNFF